MSLRDNVTKQLGYAEVGASQADSPAQRRFFEGRISAFERVLRMIEEAEEEEAQGVGTWV